MGRPMSLRDWADEQGGWQKGFVYAQCPAYYENDEGKLVEDENREYQECVQRSNSYTSARAGWMDLYFYRDLRGQLWQRLNIEDPTSAIPIGDVDLQNITFKDFNTNTGDDE